MKNLTMRELIGDLNAEYDSNGKYITGFKFETYKIDDEMQEIINNISSKVRRDEYKIGYRGKSTGYGDKVDLLDNCYYTGNLFSALLTGEKVTVAKDRFDTNRHLVEGEIRKSLLYQTLRRPSLYEYCISYVLSELMNYHKDFDLTENQVITYCKAILCRGMLKYKSYRSYKPADEFPAISRFVDYSLGKIYEIKTDNVHLKVELLKEVLYDLMNTDFNLFRKVYKEAKTGSTFRYVINEMNSDEFIDYLLDSASKSFKKNKAKMDIIDLIFSVYGYCDDNLKDRIVKFYIENLSDKELTSTLKRNPKLSDNEKFMDKMREIKKEEDSNVDKGGRGTPEYFKQLATSLETVKHKPKKITTLDSMQYINKQELTELQLVLIEKILDVSYSYSETMISKGGYGKLISTEPRIFNSLVSLVNTMNDKQYESSIKFIDMIVMQYIASKPFFDSVPNSMISVCNDTRLAEAFLLSLEKRKLGVVRTNFIAAYAKSGAKSEAFKWAMKEFMKLDEIMLLDKKNYPQLCKAYIKYAI